MVANAAPHVLSAVLEKIMEDISFTAPDMDEGTVVTIDEDTVVKKIGPMLKKDDLSRFIL
jgi:ATP-dependent protease HslVU (ClpYQ) ATPase subunit